MSQDSTIWPAQLQLPRRQIDLVIDPTTLEIDLVIDPTTLANKARYSCDAYHLIMLIISHAVAHFRAIGCARINTFSEAGTRSLAVVPWASLERIRSSLVQPLALAPSALRGRW